MRIFVDQGGAYGNLGDEAMLMAAVARLRQMDPSCQIVVSAEHDAPLPDIGPFQRVSTAVSLLRSIGAALRRRWWIAGPARTLLGRSWDGLAVESLLAHPQRLPGEYQSAIREFQAVIDGCDMYYHVGAANLHDWALRDCVLPRAWTVEQFARQNKPVVISCQTVGPLKSRVAAQRVRQMAQASTYFTLRDAGVSIRCMESLAVPRHQYQAIGDEAFDLTPAPESQVTDYLKAHALDGGQPFTLVHIRSRNYRGRIAADNPVLMRTLEALAQRRPVLLCPMSYGLHSGIDAAFAQAVAAIANLPGRIIPGQTIKDVRLVRGLVQCATSVVPLSYHLQVFALAAGKPLVCLSSGDYYAYKARALLDWLTPASQFLIDLDQPDADARAVVESVEGQLAYLAKTAQEAGNEIRQRQKAFFARMQYGCGLVRPMRQEPAEMGSPSLREAA